MTHGLLARRYAAVLFEVVEPRGEADLALEQLSTLHDLTTTYPDLEQVFAAPTLPAAKKRAVVEALAARLGVLPAVARLLTLLADRERLGLLGDLVTAFRERVMQARKVMAVEVTTAAPLDASGRAALTRALGRAAGCDVTLSERVDPEIVGGLVARMGGTVFDGSLTRQLERFKERLGENA